MKKKQYLRPAMQVVVLKQHAQLLAGSQTRSSMDEEFVEENWNNE